MNFCSSFTLFLNFSLRIHNIIISKKGSQLFDLLFNFPTSQLAASFSTSPVGNLEEKSVFPIFMKGYLLSGISNRVQGISKTR